MAAARRAEGRRADRVCLHLDIDSEIFRLAKLSKPSILPQTTVRTRRAYFDFKYGQLHVRTAFPGTGGFDEQVTLICLDSVNPIRRRAPLSRTARVPCSI